MEIVVILNSPNQLGSLHGCGIFRACELESSVIWQMTRENGKKTLRGTAHLSDKGIGVGGQT